MKALILTATLLLSVLAVAPAAEAEPMCMEVYSRHDVGNYAIVRRDSCSVEVFYCPTPGAPIDKCEGLLQ